MVTSLSMEKFPDYGGMKAGWPWDENAQSVSVLMPNGKSWPKISIITPSFNQGEYIEETIRSVLLQGYPNIEYIIMDGGSSDQTVEIIKKYEAWITYWVSEKDGGQAEAINKGFKLSTGDYLAWINSDDILLPGALEQVALANHESDYVMLLGDVINFKSAEAVTQGRIILQKHIALKNFIGVSEPGFSWHQPGTFISRKCYEHSEGIDESLHYAFDWDWMCKLLLQEPEIIYLKTPVSGFRLHDESKTGGNMPACWKETVQVIQRYHEYLNEQEQKYILSFYSLKMAGLYFSIHPNSEKYWSRISGISMLLQSIWYRPAVVKDKLFIQLLVRAILPKICYRSK